MGSWGERLKKKAMSLISVLGKFREPQENKREEQGSLVSENKREPLL